MQAVNGAWPDTPQGPRRRLFSIACNIEDPAGRAQFLKNETIQLPVPRSSRTVPFDPETRAAIGLTRLGTSQAVATGAYAFALAMLGQT
jgi:glucokinase